MRTFFSFPEPVGRVLVLGCVCVYVCVRARARARSCREGSGNWTRKDRALLVTHGEARVARVKLTRNCPNGLTSSKYLFLHPPSAPFLCQSLPPPPFRLPLSPPSLRQGEDESEAAAAVMDTTLIDALTEDEAGIRDREGKGGKYNRHCSNNKRTEAGRTRNRVVAFLNTMSKDKRAHASKNKISRLTENSKTRKKKLKILIIAF